MNLYERRVLMSLSMYENAGDNVCYIYVCVVMEVICDSVRLCVI